MVLYHGSDKIIEKPIYGHGKTTNDYGSGFYMTKDKEIAKEWSAKENIRTSYVNIYEIDEQKLRILDLDKGNQKVLSWITLLVNYRTINIRNEISIVGKEYLIKNYLLNVDEYDMIKGYRADDCYFMFAKSFLANEITLEQLGKALELGKLGNQYVIKSKKAFDMIKYKGYEKVDAKDYYIKRILRNKDAAEDYEKVISAFDEKGKFLSDIVREKR